MQRRERRLIFLFVVFTVLAVLSSRMTRRFERASNRFSAPTMRYHAPSTEPSYDSGVVAKVKVTPSGEITLDRRVVTLDELQAALLKTREANGVVWFHRRSPDAPLPESARPVIDLIIALQLPIEMTEEDF